MSESESLYVDGRLLDFQHQPLGDVLRVDAPTGTSMLAVENAGDFRVDQKIRLAGHDDEYTVADPDCAGERIAIDPALKHDHEAGDRVAIWDRTMDRASKVPRAKVSLDDEDGGDAVEVNVAHGLANTLKKGQRDEGKGEHVRMLRDPTDGSLLLFDAPGAEDLDNPATGGGPAGAELVFSAGEVTNTTPSTARLITPLSAGRIVAVYTVADLYEADHEADILVNGESVATVALDHNLTDLDITVEAGDKVRWQATKVGAHNVGIVVVVKPGD